MLDILICIIPKINPYSPTVGPAILKAHLMKAGFSCDVVDFNIQLFKAVKANGEENKFYANDMVFTKQAYNIQNRIFYTKEFIEFYEEYEYVFFNWINFIREKNPKWLGLSLMSFHSKNVATKLSQLVKEHLPHIKIVWGGPGAGQPGPRYKRNNIIDHFIYGDGEESLIELLKGNLSYSGIDSTKPNQVSSMDNLLVPNYDDINWDDYENSDYVVTQNLIYVTGSRGCVRRCNFCDVYVQWPEYQFRSGKHIANEIIELKQKYNRKTFKFTDSLVNGSMKSFNELLTELIELRKTDTDFSWHSQWIIRTKSKNLEKDIEHFRLIKESGCGFLEIGLESILEHVRLHMNKKITNEDVWWCLELLHKFNIPHVLLMIVGYPTETEEDHQTTLNFIQKLYDLGWNDFTTISFNQILFMDSHMYENFKDDPNLIYYSDGFVWQYKDNDFETRVRRFKELNDLIRKLNFPKLWGWVADSKQEFHMQLIEVERNLKLQRSISNDSPKNNG